MDQIPFPTCGVCGKADCQTNHFEKKTMANIQNLDGRLWVQEELEGKRVLLSSLQSVRLTHDIGYPDAAEYLTYFGAGDNWDAALAMIDLGNGFAKIEFVAIYRHCDLSRAGRVNVREFWRNYCRPEPTLSQGDF
jgi:hypothetical protein